MKIQPTSAITALLGLLALGFLPACAPSHCEKTTPASSAPVASQSTNGWSLNVKDGNTNGSWNLYLNGDTNAPK